MRYEHFFFDLDGTLTDPAPGITNSIIYARKKWGLPCGPNEEYLPFIGPPMPQSFCDLWGLSMEDATRFHAVFREYFSEKGLFENRVFPGMPELLHTLKAAGGHNYVATTKPTVFAGRIAERFGLKDYFDLISGSELDRTRELKHQVIEYARDTCGVDMTKAVMIGDRSFDVEGAHLCGIPCIGVTYGYGGRDELTQAGADVIVDTIAELKEYLLG